MTTFEIGQTVSVALQTFDSAGALANVGSMTCTVTKPDGTTVAGTVTNTGTGEYQASTPGTFAGRYRFTFTATGANSGGTPWTDVADVWPADPRLIISLSDAKAELNMIPNVNDDELRLYIAAATPVVEEIVGRVLTETVVERHDGGKTGVLLHERAADITSVVVDGVTLTEGADWYASTEAGIVYAGSQSTPSRFDFGRRNVVVTYTVGDAIIPANIIAGARIIVAHQYSVGQQGRAGAGRSGAAVDVAILGSGYAVPARGRAHAKPPTFP